MAKESIVLDPSEVADADRTELDLHSADGSMLIAESGPEWGDAALQLYKAQQAWGESVVDGWAPNRQVVIPLVVGGSNAAGFAAARLALQAKVARFQAEGGWLKRTLKDGTKLYLDIVAAELKLGGGTAQALWDIDADAVLTLDCKPDFYGDEIILSDHVETTNPELIAVETAVKGDYPGRVSITVDEDQGVDQLGIKAAFRCRHYDSASTAALVYEAEALTPLDAAATTALSGASGAGSNTIRHNNLSTSWTPVLSTNLLAGTYLTHQGTYRLMARVYTTSATPPYLRFIYDVGDLTGPTENDQVAIPGPSNFYLVDLGEVRLDAAPVGTHRWQGAIQAMGAAGGENVYIDRLWFWPMDEACFTGTAPIDSSVGLAGCAARDEFNQSSGNLDAPKAAPIGGNWAEAGRTGAAGFQIDSISHILKRTQIGDADETGGGTYALSGVAAFTSQVVKVDIQVDRIPGSGGVGQISSVLARYIDTNNFWRFSYVPSNVGHPQIRVEKKVAGVLTLLKSINMDGWQGSQYYTLQIFAGKTGVWAAYVFLSGGSPGDAIAIGMDSDLATGGALASGKPGVYDGYADAVVTGTRRYDNFAAWVPTLDAAVYANQSAYLRTDGNYRESSDGLSVGPIADPTGDLLRLPVSGDEGRPVEMMVKLSPGDFDQVPDSSNGKVSARISYRPSWLFVPGS